MRPLIPVLLATIAMALFPHAGPEVLAQVPAVDPFPQNVWEWKNPLPAGQTIADFCVVDENVTYASCLGGLVLRTTDGGGSWQVLNTGVPGWLSGLDFTDPLTGTVVGQVDTDGIILRTTDGGLSWQHQEWEQLEWLEDVDFLDAQTGVAVGRSGTIVWTTDGGQTWDVRDAGTTEWLRSVHLLDDQTAIVAGGQGIICRTDDAGLSWNFPETHTTERLESLAFGDGNNGVVVGRNGVVLATQNGGDFWSLRSSGTGQWLDRVSFLDSETAVFCGGGGALYCSTSGGLYWSPLVPPVTSSLGAVAFTEAGHLLVAASYGAFWESDEAWESWTAHHQGPGVNFFAAATPGDLTAVVAGGDGTIMRSEDSGLTWTEISTPTTQHLVGIDFAPDQYGSPSPIGMAVGNGGLALRTEDGGLSWTALETGNTVGFWDVACPSAQRAVAVGWSNVIVVTEDGGQTWTEVMGGDPYDYHQAVFFLDPLTGWTSTFYGDIHHTTDGGHHWSVQHDSNLDLTDIMFSDQENGMAVGGVDGNATLVTTDGGLHWTQQANPNHAYLYGIYRSLTGKCLAVGQGMFRSFDGGETWAEDDSFDVFFNDILVLENGTGIAVGRGGAILRAEPMPVIPVPDELPGFPAALKAYPNPFNPMTTVAYRIPRSGHVTLDIHDLRGHRVATLVEAFQAAGGHEVTWQALDPAGRVLPSGTYFVRVVLEGRPVGPAVGLSLIK